METPQEIRWGIVGCGNVCEVKSGPAFSRVPGSTLQAVMRRDADAARDYASRHGVPRCTTEADEIIQAEDVDAVYIATPPGTHLRYALEVCRAGKPAYVEKPMTRTWREGRDMVDAFHAAGLPLFIAFYRRALPRFLQARELIESDALGTISQVNYRLSQPKHRDLDPQNIPWRLQAEHSGGGLFLDLASHTLDILDFLLGPIEDVAGLAGNLAGGWDVEDGVVMHFRHASGVLGSAGWNFASDAFEDHIDITGTRGRLSMSCFGNDPLRFQSGEDVREFDRPNPQHIQEPLITTIVGELLGRSECPSTGVTALRTMRVMDEVLRSYYGGREDAFWARPKTWPGRP